MAEPPASDRIAFALSLIESGVRICPAEKSQDGDPVLSGAARSLQSDLSRNNREILTCFGHGKGRVNFSAVKTCWQSKYDSNLHYLLNSASPDVYVSCAASIGSEILQQTGCARQMKVFDIHLSRQHPASRLRALLTRRGKTESLH